MLVIGIRLCPLEPRALVGDRWSICPLLSVFCHLSKVELFEAVRFKQHSLQNADNFARLIRQRNSSGLTAKIESTVLATPSLFYVRRKEELFKNALSFYQVDKFLLKTEYSVTKSQQKYSTFATLC